MAAVGTSAEPRTETTSPPGGTTLAAAAPGGIPPGARVVAVVRSPEAAAGTPPGGTTAAVAATPPGGTTPGGTVVAATPPGGTTTAPPGGTTAAAGTPPGGTVAAAAAGTTAAPPGGTTTAATIKITPEEVKPFERQIVYIAGEAVAFTPTGFPKGEPSIVQFDDYYKPDDMSLSDAMILKNALKQLFGSVSLPVYDTKLGKELPQKISLPMLPPCDEIQKKLVMRSLQYRFELLRQELNVRGIRSYQDMRKRMEELKRSGIIGSVEGEDSLDIRRNIQHFQLLKQLMEKYEKSQQCFNLEDKAFGALELDLTDERARELLKQFIFFTLQAHHPLQEYKKTNPTAPAFVKRLEINPLGDTFPRFMTTYKGNKLPIPESIARVLESIGTEPGLMDKELKRRLEDAFQNEKDKILTFLYGYFPPEDRFWRTVGKEKDVYRIVEKLMERLREEEGKVDSLMKEKTDLEAKLKACESAKTTLKQSEARLTEQVKTLTAQLAAMGGKDEEIARLNTALAKAIADHTAKQRSLEEEKNKLQADLNRNLALLEGLKPRIAALFEENEGLKRRVEELLAAEAAIKANLEEVRRNFEAEIAAEKARTAAESSAKRTAIEAKETADAALAAAKAEILGKNKTLEANLAQIATLEKAVSDCNGETAKVRNALQEKTEEAERLTQEKAALLARAEKAEEDLGRAKEALSSSEGKQDELNKEILELQNLITELKRKLADTDAALKKCEAEKTAMKEPADALAAKAASLEGELAAAKSRADALQADKERLAAEITRLGEQAKAQAAVVVQLKADLRTKTEEFDEMETRAEAAEGERDTAREALGRATADLDGQRQLVARQRDELLAQNASHAKQIGDLTNDFKVQLATEVGKTADEARRAGLAEAAVLEQSRAFETLRAAVKALVDMDPEDTRPVRDAIGPVVDTDAKGYLEALYAKLLESLAAPVTPRTAAAKAAEHMAAQCQNALLLTYLWQTNFPQRDAQSQMIYRMINNIFTSGPYPGKGALLAGLYNNSQVDLPIANKYLALIKKLLTIFFLDEPRSAEEAAVKNEVTTLSEEEAASLGLLMAKIKEVESAYKSADAKAAASGASSSSSSAAGSGPAGSGITPYIVLQTRENMERLQPSLLYPMKVKGDNERTTVQEVISYLPSETLTLDPASKQITKTVLPTPLSYPVLFYCFMILMRDVLNRTSTSLSRQGKCPLPQILVRK